MTDLARDGQLSDEQLAEWERVAAELAPPDTLPAVRISRVDRLLMAVPLLVRALRDARVQHERERDRADAAERALAYQLPMLHSELVAVETERDSLRDENRRLRSAIEQAFREAGAGRGVEILRAALAAPTGDRQDWTADANGRSNSSDTFVAIVAIVARLLRSEMWSITQDDAGRESAARLIVAQLAHKHGFAPVAAPTGQEAQNDA